MSPEQTELELAVAEITGDTFTVTAMGVLAETAVALSCTQNVVELLRTGVVNTFPEPRRFPCVGSSYHVSSPVPEAVIVVDCPLQIVRFETDVVLVGGGNVPPVEPWAFTVSWMQVNSMLKERSSGDFIVACFKRDLFIM